MSKLLRSRIASPVHAAAAALSLLAGVAAAQDVDMRGDGSNNSVVFQGKNINPNSLDIIGVHGQSEPVGFYGIGVRGTGGWKGVEGYATLSGSGTRIGVLGSASNGTSSNYAFYGTSLSATGTSYGAYLSASGTGSRGVYASATGANSRAGYFSGSLEYTGSLIGPSDAKLKKNVAPIRNCALRLSRLSPKEFDYRADEFATMRLPKSHQMGLIAQDVEAVFPDLVEESIAPEAEAGDGKSQATAERVKYKGVNYIGLIPVLIGAIKEQQEEIAALKKALQVAK